jgi:hypothetical protein
MADPVTTDQDILDCSTISISYQINGLANISFTVYRPITSGPPYSKGGPGFELVAGGVRFKGFVTSQNLIPASDVLENMWSVTAVAIGCKDTGNLQTC